MRALHVPAAGQQPQLSDLPIPEVTEGTVLIRVKAAGLNAFDNAVAAGMLAEMVPHDTRWCSAGTPPVSSKPSAPGSTMSRSATR